VQGFIYNIQQKKVIYNYRVALFNYNKVLVIDTSFEIFSSFLPIILKIFISGSVRISWLVVRFPFFRFFWLKLKLNNDIFLKICQH